MAFRLPPGYAAWQHFDARNGFEVVFSRSDGEGFHLDGVTAAVERDDAWGVWYTISVDRRWLTHRACITGLAQHGRRELTLEADVTAGWRINGKPAGYLDGCLDVDLESSALTNAFPVHRLGLEIGEEANAPAAYVRAVDLSVERLEQHYRRLDDHGNTQRYRYRAPGFQFECELVYDEFGLVTEYPGIARRTA